MSTDDDTPVHPSRPPTTRRRPRLTERQAEPFIEELENPNPATPDDEDDAENRHERWLDRINGSR